MVHTVVASEASGGPPLCPYKRDDDLFSEAKTGHPATRNIFSMGKVKKHVAQILNLFNCLSLQTFSIFPLFAFQQNEKGGGDLFQIPQPLQTAGRPKHRTQISGLNDWNRIASWGGSHLYLA